MQDDLCVEKKEDSVSTRVKIWSGTCLGTRWDNQASESSWHRRLDRDGCAALRYIHALPETRPTAMGCITSWTNQRVTTTICQGS
jgi:hypothetical protein